MKRKLYTVPIGSGGRRYRVVMEDVPSEGSGIKIRAYEFLRELCVDGAFTGLLDCGPAVFTKMTMEHKDGRYVVILEAEEQSGGIT